jgi:hypothetical protein
MILRLFCSATVVLVLTCLKLTNLHACPISLQIQNHSAFIILGVKFRQHGSDSWDHASIPLGPNNNTTLNWSDAAISDSYDVEVVYSNRPDHPNTSNICDICTVSQITILNDRVNIRGNCSGDQ